MEASVVARSTCMQVFVLFFVTVDMLLWQRSKVREATYRIVTEELLFCLQLQTYCQAVKLNVLV